MPPLSAYGESVPHPPAGGGARAAERFARLRELRAPVALEDVRDLVSEACR